MSWTEANKREVKDCIKHKVEKWITDGNALDCADVALTAIAECAASKNLPLNIPVWDSASGKWKRLRSKDYNNTSSYAGELRNNLGAINLFDRDKVTVIDDLDKLEPGDLIVFDLRYQNNPSYTGHTMVVLSNNISQKKVAVGEGHVGGPPTKASYSYPKIKQLWRGPEGGAGREWNWQEIVKN